MAPEMYQKNGWFFHWFFYQFCLPKTIQNGSQNGTEKPWKFNGWSPKRRWGARGATHGTQETPVAPKMEPNGPQNTQNGAPRLPKWGSWTPRPPKIQPWRPPKSENGPRTQANDTPNFQNQFGISNITQNCTNLTNLATTIRKWCEPSLSSFASMLLRPPIFKYQHAHLCCNGRGRRIVAWVGKKNYQQWKHKSTKQITNGTTQLKTKQQCTSQQTNEQTITQTSTMARRNARSGWVVHDTIIPVTVIVAVTGLVWLLSLFKFGPMLNYVIWKWITFFIA